MHQVSSRRTISDVRPRIVVAVLALIMGCHEAAPSSTEMASRHPVTSEATEAALPTSPAVSTDDAMRTFEGTVHMTVVDRDGQYPARLVDVRAARHDGFDRVVFEFSGPVPGYHVEFIDRPVRQCGSGHVTRIAGDAWLEVRMTPVHAHDEQGAPTIAARERSLMLPVLKELELTCDFEAIVTWVLGVGSPNAYRVRELTNPSRLVVDVLHR